MVFPPLCLCSPQHCPPLLFLAVLPPPVSLLATSAAGQFSSSSSLIPVSVAIQFARSLTFSSNRATSLYLLHVYIVLFSDINTNCTLCASHHPVSGSSLHDLCYLFTFFCLSLSAFCLICLEECWENPLIFNFVSLVSTFLLSSSSRSFFSYCLSLLPFTC